MELVCIVCPNGCRMQVQQGEQLEVKGAMCKRGVQFAKEELTCPMRTVTTTVATTVEGYPTVSVRTEREIPKQKVFDLVRLLAHCVVEQRLAAGSVVVENALGTGVNVIVTTDMTQQ